MLRLYISTRCKEAVIIIISVISYKANSITTAFQARSSGLSKFTCMPFGLSNVRSSFCCLMEKYLGYQQYVTYMQSLNDICMFALDASNMLYCIEVIFIIL